MEYTATSKTLTDKDLEKLREVLKHVAEGTACTYDKPKCMEYLDSVISPRCSVCRKVLSGDVVFVNDYKMHAACRKRYKG